MIKLISFGSDHERTYIALLEISYGEAMEKTRSLIGVEIAHGRLYLDLLFLRIG